MIFLQQLSGGYRFPALIHVCIASAGVLEWFISTSGETTLELLQESPIVLSKESFVKYVYVKFIKSYLIWNKDAIAT